MLSLNTVFSIHKVNNLKKINCSLYFSDGKSVLSKAYPERSFWGPLFWKNHFILLWFLKKKNSLLPKILIFMQNNFKIYPKNFASQKSSSTTVQKLNYCSQNMNERWKLSTACENFTIMKVYSILIENMSEPTHTQWHLKRWK